MNTQLVKTKVNIVDFFKTPSRYLANQEDLNTINSIFSKMDGLIYGKVDAIRLDSAKKCWTGNVKINLNGKNIIQQLQKHQIPCLECFEFVL